jgi:flagellin-like protein
LMIQVSSNEAYLAMIRAMVIAATDIIQYALFSPVWFNLIDAWYSIDVAHVTSPGGAAILPAMYGLLRSLYPVFSALVLVAVTIWLYLYIRRRYYASEGVFIG